MKKKASMKKSPLPLLEVLVIPATEYGSSRPEVVISEARVLTVVLHAQEVEWSWV